ncbi:MAG: molecular chaperone DnaJ [Candidatus Moraniibacteriota bacterium]|nr:MAG: molecular chaperone DnaJ [Candidatus Moranbacteria bacterium]
MAKDYYSILGVAKGATQDELKKAYRKLAHAHHPDKTGGDEAKFKEINEAYGILGDPEKRRQYDQFGQAFSGAGGGPSGQGFGGFDFSNFSNQGFGFGGANMEDLFSDIFTGGGRRARSGHGADIQVDISISFEEMVRGTKRTVRLRKQARCNSCSGSGGAPGASQESCPDCHGKGSVMRNVNTILGTFTQSTACGRCHARGKVFSESCRTCRGDGRTEQEISQEVSIPEGIGNGQALSISGEGAAGEYGAPAGDLYVVVHVEPHPELDRRGDDITSEKKLRFDQFVLGDKVPVKTIDGTVNMKVPAGTQPGETFRIRGKGIPRLGRFGRGDHLVRVDIEIPRHPSEEMKRHIEALRGAERG